MYLNFIRNFVFFSSGRSLKLHKLHAPQNLEPPLDCKPALLIILLDKGALKQDSLRVPIFFPISIVTSMVDTQVLFIYHPRHIILTYDNIAVSSVFNLFSNNLQVFT